MVTGTRDTYSVDDDFPGQIPFEVLNIDQDSLQLDNSQSRVGIVELNSHLIGELLPRSVGFLEAADNII